MKDGEDPLDRSCEEWRSIAKSQKEEIFPANNKRRKTNWTGLILRRKCLLKPDMEGKIEGKMEVKGRLGRRHKQLLGKLKEEKSYWNLKGEALDGSVWSIRFGRYYGPVVRRHCMKRV